MGLEGEGSGGEGEGSGVKGEGSGDWVPPCPPPQIYVTKINDYVNESRTKL